MTADDLPLPAPARPLWLVTLADLSLLLVGFFVLLQANRDLDPRRLAEGLAAGFGVTAPAMPVAGNAIDGFAPGRADLPYSPAALAAWAGAELRDPRVRLTVTGVADTVPGHGDVDAASGSGAACEPSTICCSARSDALKTIGRCVGDKRQTHRGA